MLKHLEGQGIRGVCQRRRVCEPCLNCERRVCQPCSNCQRKSLRTAPPLSKGRLCQQNNTVIDERGERGNGGGTARGGDLPRDNCRKGTGMATRRPERQFWNKQNMTGSSHSLTIVHKKEHEEMRDGGVANGLGRRSLPCCQRFVCSLSALCSTTAFHVFY